MTVAVVPNEARETRIHRRLLRTMFPTDLGVTNVAESRWCGCCIALLFSKLASTMTLSDDGQTFDEERTNPKIASHFSWSRERMTTMSRREDAVEENL